MITFNKEKVFSSLWIILIVAGVIFYLYLDNEKKEISKINRKLNEPSFVEVKTRSDSRA